MCSVLKRNSNSLPSCRARPLCQSRPRILSQGTGLSSGTGHCLFYCTVSSHVTPPTEPHFSPPHPVSGGSLLPAPAWRKSNFQFQCSNRCVFLIMMPSTPASQHEKGWLEPPVTTAPWFGGPLGAQEMGDPLQLLCLLGTGFLVSTLRDSLTSLDRKLRVPLALPNELFVSAKHCQDWFATEVLFKCFLKHVRRGE